MRVARVTRAHGLRGEVVLEMLGGGADRLAAGEPVRVSGGEVRIEAIRPAAPLVLCRFQGVDDRARAQTLVGEYLEVPAGEVRPLPADEYFHFQLVGLRVRDEDGRERGTVADIEEYPANDIVVVETPSGQALVPAVHDAVLNVDLVKGEMTVARRFLEEWVDAI